MLYTENKYILLIFILYIKTFPSDTSIYAPTDLCRCLLLVWLSAYIPTYLSASLLNNVFKYTYLLIHQHIYLLTCLPTYIFSIVSQCVHIAHYGYFSIILSN